jgi:hypothetical protein
MAEADTIKCPSCGFENEVGATKCAKEFCGVRLSGTQFTELEYLKSIDKSLKAIKTIAVFWLALFVIGLALFLLNRSLPDSTP